MNQCPECGSKKTEVLVQRIVMGRIESAQYRCKGCGIEYRVGPVDPKAKQGK
jgi:predicted RNA-binding Zn-ribbon protein involved in translation (DUF1610 family)